MKIDKIMHAFAHNTLMKEFIIMDGVLLLVTCFAVFISSSEFVGLESQTTPIQKKGETQSKILSFWIRIKII